MIARLGRHRDVLVVAPHPDDEAIGAFGLMSILRRRGARIRVLVVTDGSASHPGSVRWPAARLIRERRRETRRAMAALGIPPSRIRFLGLADGALSDDPGLVRSRCGRALRRMPVPDLIVGPLPDDAHADHRTVAAALAGRRNAPGRRIGYRVWPLGPDRAGRLALPLDAQTRAAKRRAVRSYRTQGGRITDSPTGMTMRSHHLRAFAGPSERFRLLP